MSGHPEMAPKAGAVSARLKKGFEKLAADKENLEKMAQTSAEATWFDADSPATRKRRETVRANYEECIRTVFEKTTPAEIWDVDTFVEYSKQFLDAMVQLSTGNIGEKIRTDVLWQHKEGLYWWAVRMIKKFTTIYANWHSETVAQIHLLARKYNLEQSHRPKPTLGATELVLFYRQLFSFFQGLDNWKQHYAAYVLVYVTGVRPGSFTVCPGYEQGASLGATNLVRPADETLRWSDLEFFRFPDVDGIAVRITFKYLKNQRNPFTKQLVEGKKKFTFLPTRGERFELDLSAIFLALAFSRGLFPFKTLEEVMKCENMYIPTVDKVSKRPVFVASDQAGDVSVDVAMREFSLNPKLQAICRSVGLLEQNTIYAFRRTAITETRREMGTEFARELAGHKPNTSSIVSYDVQGIGDVDITALRTQDPAQQAVTRKAIRDAFAQAKVSRLSTDGDAGNSLQIQLNERADKAMQSDKEYLKMEHELDEMLLNLASLLDIEPLELIHGVFEDYRARLREKNLDDALLQFDNLLARRKTLRKKLRTKYMKEQKEQMLGEHKKSLKVTKHKAGAPHGRGRQPQAIRDATTVDPAALEDSHEAAINTLSTSAGEAGEDDEEGGDVDDIIDQDALDESANATREEPVHWRKLKDDVVVHPEGDDDGTSTPKARLAFLKSFVNLTSVSTSNFTCVLCALDPTVSEKVKKETYNRGKLDRHLKGNFHSREQEIQRALDNTVVNNRLNCPECNKEMAKTAFMKHLESEHPEFL